MSDAIAPGPIVDIPRGKGRPVTSLRKSDVVEVQQHLARIEEKVDALSMAVLEMGKAMIARGSL